ncbi:hypothetical protein [Streptomyces liangshanensis]|uniref:Uncharacterized protein n=1 Tax=Streptomyces liangshanensis TaxID=2717324 RepID=A0A6G9GX70_9ACTN|nr:hypothetical protein [Streptomyces liangshanensis]QIQ02872.1 hypothetical protein HA039_11540 [Streptomyces liangshanensis]
MSSLVRLTRLATAPLITAWWLVVPGAGAARAAGSGQSPAESGWAGNLVLPLGVLVLAVVIAGYVVTKRRRRAARAAERRAAWAEREARGGGRPAGRGDTRGGP